MTLPKKETIQMYRQALQVGFLSKEEVNMYFLSLMRAYYWGKKIDEKKSKKHSERKE